MLLRTIIFSGFLLPAIGFYTLPGAGPPSRMHNHGLAEDLPEGKGVGTTPFLEGKMINTSVRRHGAVNFGNPE